MLLLITLFVCGMVNSLVRHLIKAQLRLKNNQQLVLLRLLVTITK